MLRILKGNLFASNCQTLVNTVNCAGIMGAGIAPEFKLRYPAMFKKYEKLCHEGRMETGKLWLYKSPGEQEGNHWVLNFPTKRHWKHPSRESYLHDGLRNFVQTYRKRGIESIAFPILGASNGKIRECVAVGIMASHLYECDDLDIEIYAYDANAPDDVYNKLKRTISNQTDEQLVHATGIRIDRVRMLRDVVERGDQRSFGQLAGCIGVGEKTLAAVFDVLCGNDLSAAQVAPTDSRDVNACGDTASKQASLAI